MQVCHETRTLIAQRAPPPQADRWHGRFLGRIPLGLILLCLPAVVHPAIYQCRLVDGSRAFQDRPCALEPARAPTRAAHPPAGSQAAPGGVHPSWMQAPEPAWHSATCQPGRCQCGELARKLTADIEQAVADALYLDGSWHRFETLRAQWPGPADTPAAERLALRAQLDTAACDVMLSQAVLRQHLLDAFDAFRRYRRTAEAQGFDDPALCSAADTRACEYRDRLARFKRLKRDLKALQQPRPSLLPLDQ